MKLDPLAGGIIWDTWLAGGALVGPNKPHTRVTVQPGWTLQTQSPAGTRPAAKLPIRWFQAASNAQAEVELPGVRSIEVSYDIDQDASTLVVQMTNNNLDPNFAHWADANGDFGRPGYFTPDHGTLANRWGYVPNEWSGVLNKNTLCRTYEGYGGQDKSLAQAIADGNLVLTGVWLVDDVPIKTGQQFTLQARSMAKLLIDQLLYPPLVPTGDYPLERSRFYYPLIVTPVVIYGHAATPPTLRILKIERPPQSNGYWLVGSDGGVFTYGLAHFYGSTDSDGITVTTGTYPVEGVTGMTTTPTGAGYWLAQDNGTVYHFGDAGVLAPTVSVDPAAHPIIAIESVPGATVQGYWMLDDAGAVYAVGSAVYHGNAAVVTKAVDMAATPSGNGYWIIDSSGHVYALGDATYHGNIPAAHPVVAIAPTPSGLGYYACDTAGDVYTAGDAQFYGSIPGLVPAITLNDPISDMIVSADGTGYWLCGEDGGVFTFRATGSTVQFMGSLPGATADDYPVNGSYLDLTDIVKDIALYCGFYLYDAGATDNVYGNIENTGIYTLDNEGSPLDATFFDKKQPIEPLTKLKEVVGYSLYVGDEGELHFHESNIWQSGNFLQDQSHTDSVPVIDERTNLIDYQRSTPDKDLRSEIIVSNSDPLLNLPGTTSVDFVDASATADLKGLVRPAIFINEFFTNSTTLQTMAQLIALQIYFKSRLGRVGCVANPLIQINDQIQIQERETFEAGNYHYVRAIKRTHDKKSGKYEMQLTTNILSPGSGPWAIVKPNDSPTGTVTTNRTL